MDKKEKDRKQIDEMNYMRKEDHIYTDSDGYKIRMVALVPEKPERVLLIPPLVGATGAWAISTFRYFSRKSSILMSFDYCGHYQGVDNKFTIKGTFKDTEAAISYATEYTRKKGLPLHAIGTCYGLIPLIYILDALGWPEIIRSMFSVNGLFSMNELINFDNYKDYLKKRGLFFKNKADFIEFMSRNKDKIIRDRKIYVKALTEYLAEIFPELIDIISDESFGTLDYSRVEFYQSFYEFIASDLPEIKITKNLPCLFFFGENDKTLNLKEKENKNRYVSQIKKMASHAQLCDIRIDHFGRGEDHYVIGEKGMSFLKENESI